MLTIPWDLARKKWHGRTMIIKPEWHRDTDKELTHDTSCWRGEIQDSYYPRPKETVFGANPMVLRIRVRPESMKCAKTPPTGDLLSGEWLPCDALPRLVVSTRMIDLAVTETCEGKKGGDLWCFFEVPDEHQRRTGPYLKRGWFVVLMDKKKRDVLRLAMKLKEERVSTF